MNFDTEVSCIHGRNVGVVKLRDLEIGEEFEHEGKRFTLAIEKQPFSYRSTGDRVLVDGQWAVVVRHGNCNVVFPTKDPEDPFSEMLNSSNMYLPYPTEDVKFLTFK